MRSIITPSLLALTVMAAAPAQAADPYLGGSALFLDAEDSELDLDASLTAVTGRLGSFFNDNMAGEVRVSLGVDGDTVGSGIFKADVDLKSMIGGYLRLGAPVSDSLFPYAVVGFTRTELEVDFENFGSESDSETDISYGLGVDLSLDRNLRLNVEYMNYYDKDDTEITGFSIGIVSRI
ncbi:MAG: porin family protein [Pseudomonadota bacterium]|nr:porin family protein [Pseudomonadota bacterium]